MDIYKKCKHCMAVTKNEIGETLILCDIWDEWRNVTLGDCFGNCESQEEDNNMDNDYEEDDYDPWDDYDWCYECTGYGDDYSYDEDGELVSNCDNCPNNPNRHDPWDD